MDMHAPIILDLPPAHLLVLRLQAKAAGLSPSAMARRLLTEALNTPSHCDAATAPIRTSDRPSLLAPLRSLLEPELARARGWDDLQSRLGRHGYTFHERGDGLGLFCGKTAAHICTASELGWRDADLARRFGQPFSGHSHTQLARRVPHRATPPTRTHPKLLPDPGGRNDPDEDDDDIILIEPW